MKTIPYPSKRFKAKARNLLGEGVKFAVIVPRDNSKKEILMAKLENIFLGKTEKTTKLNQIVGTYRILDFLSAFSGPLTGRDYVVSFKDEGDLVVTFEPIVSKETKA